MKILLFRSPSNRWLVIVLLGVAISVLGLSCSMGGYTHYTYYPGNRVRTKCSYDMQGRPTGTWVLYREDGSVLAEGTYRNGRPWNGLFFAEDDLHDPPALTAYQEGKILSSPSP